MPKEKSQESSGDTEDEHQQEINISIESPREEEKVSAPKRQQMSPYDSSAKKVKSDDKHESSPLSQQKLESEDEEIKSEED